uniref:Uncharacterized protein n=1 Tax=Rhizophora mucronata TaxID=61149 RepID=A0A2P2NZL2_RHIMU
MIHGKCYTTPLRAFLATEAAAAVVLIQFIVSSIPTGTSYVCRISTGV